MFSVNRYICLVNQNDRCLGLQQLYNMHVLFHVDTPSDIPVEISEVAVKAADCFVDYCLQQAAYLGGRGDFETAVEEFQQGVLYKLYYF